MPSSLRAILLLRRKGIYVLPAAVEEEGKMTRDYTLSIPYSPAFLPTTHPSTLPFPMPVVGKEEEESLSIAWRTVPAATTSFTMPFILSRHLFIFHLGRRETFIIPPVQLMVVITTHYALTAPLHHIPTTACRLVLCLVVSYDDIAYTICKRKRAKRKRRSGIRAFCRQKENMLKQQLAAAALEWHILFILHLNASRQRRAVII